MSSDRAKRLRVCERGGDADASQIAATRPRQLIRLAVLASAAWLAACAQPPVASNRSALTPSRQAALEHHRYRRVARATALSEMNRDPVVERDARANASTRRSSSGEPGNSAPFSQGVASFYTEGTETASGEKFNTHELTAAHPTLPFGTRLRVTNFSSGRSVIVRVNDRGPYIRGRVVDVSYSAAEALGMVGRGVAKVRLDVVQ